MTPSDGSIILARALVQSAPPAARKQAAALHWKLQLLGLAGAAIGGAAIYFNKGNRPHLTSWHAIVGAATASAAVLAAIGGALVRWSPALFRTALGRVRALNAHRTAGLFVQLGIAATLSLMILDHFAATQFSDLGRFALTVSWVALNATLWRRLARLVIGWGSSI
ncbi:hypothetical protein HK105_204030 [Polyrhizophydium stewartii]|uniref:Cytochrome b561 domain-containing protein n=1 Tax=Polyrhizophydium stewartii TaxID=2732419 RepID=A0ABR4N9Y5_9FUNG